MNTNHSPNRFICGVLAVLYAPLGGNLDSVALNGPVNNGKRWAHLQKHTIKFTFSEEICIWRESGTTLLAQDSLGQGGLGHLAWPGTQDGLGQGRLRLKWAKGRFGSKIDEKMKVLRMSLPIVESLSGPQESIFNLSRGTQLHFGEKFKKLSKFIRFADFPPFPLFGVP